MCRYIWIVLMLALLPARSEGKFWEKPEEIAEESLPGTVEDTTIEYAYESVIPGVRVPGVGTIGGVYRKVPISNYGGEVSLISEGQKSSRALNKAFRYVGVGVAVLGIFMAMGAAYSFAQGGGHSYELGVGALICVATGVVLCIWLVPLLIIVTVLALIACGWGAYSAYKRFRANQARLQAEQISHDLVDAADVIKSRPVWDPEAKLQLMKAQSTEAIDFVEASQESRELDPARKARMGNLIPQ